MLPAYFKRRSCTPIDAFAGDPFGQMLDVTHTRQLQLIRRQDTTTKIVATLPRLALRLQLKALASLVFVISRPSKQPTPSAKMSMTNESFDEHQKEMMSSMETTFIVLGCVGAAVFLLSCFCMWKAHKNAMTTFGGMAGQLRVFFNNGVPVAQPGDVGFPVAVHGAQGVAGVPGNHAVPMQTVPGGFAYVCPSNTGVVVTPEGLQPGMVIPGGMMPLGAVMLPQVAAPDAVDVKVCAADKFGSN